ncbi:TapB family protein [Desulfotomaculum sp. 1211_IL3151]|uniref:TapB family protein n=1 Tax=Desulfotomaculum sp. 1211_IL3151 TaxID=3084055 RepID=UPI002FD9C33A
MLKKIMRSKLTWFFILLLALFYLYRVAPIFVSPSESKNLRDFFPMTKGSTWEYQGEGNEYASFSREVLFLQDNKAQLREDNGGTVSISVLQVTDQEISRIYFQGEAYEDTNVINQEPNDHTIILKLPLSVGTKWDVPHGNREIVSINATVETPAGSFTNCIKVKVTQENSTIFEYFKQDVGLVKREFFSEGTQVTSSLETYHINP